MSGKVYQIGLTLLILIMLVDGCAFTKSEPTPLPPIPSNTLTASQTATLTPTFTETSTPTMSPTLQPTETITLSTPLTDAQIELNIIDSLKNNANCPLPCWWGIRPGSTSWSDASATLQRFGLQPSFDTISGAYTLIYMFPSYTNRDMTFRIDLFVENDHVRTINFESEGYTNFASFKKIYTNLAPEQIMAAYGPPDQVDATGGFGSKGVYYDLSFYYDHLGFRVSYSGIAPAIAFQSKTASFCPTFGPKGNLSGSVNLELASNNVALTHEGSTVNLEKFGSMTPQDLYNLYIRNQDDVCFDTPIDLWY